MEIDSRGALWATNNTNNTVGVSGVTPTSLQTYGAARTRLNENSAPAGDRGLIMSPQMEENLSAAVTIIFHPQPDVTKAFKEGSLGRLSGFDTYESNQLYSHVNGTWAGAVTVTGANQSGSSLLITATAGDTFFIGDTFTVALMNNANPGTRRSTGRLKQFVVTQPLTAAGGGADQLFISPSIDGPGSQYQNVDALNGAGAAMTLCPGTASPNGKSGIQGLALTKMAFALVGLPLEKPTSQEMASSIRDPASGLSMRFVKSWDQQSSSMRHRLETVIGFGNLYPDNCAVRVNSLA
jgi:hypothetical protein